MMPMLSVKRSQAPTYLMESAFYKSLNEEDDEEILIPANNLKKTPNVSDSTELVHLLSTSRFWGLDDLPADALHYVMYRAEKDAFVRIREFEDHRKTIACLKAIRFAEGAQKVLCAAEFGRIDFIQYLMKMGNVLQVSAGIQAASNNHLACLEFITNTLTEKTGKNPYKLFQMNKLPVTIDYAGWKHLHQHGGRIDWHSLSKTVVDASSSCLQFLHENKALVTEQIMNAVTNGHLAYFASDYDVLAAAGGHLECLKHLFAISSSRAPTVSTAAANGGHLECLKYAHELGCAIDSTTMSRCESLECIKYMRQHGVDWHKNVFTYAMAGERMDFLQYFHEQGALTVKLQHSAACTTTGVSLRFLYEHGVVVNTETVHRDMIPEDKLVCLKIAMEFGYKPTAEDCAVAAEYGAIECLKYLHSCQCPCDESLCTRAARRLQLVTLKFALEHGCSWSTDLYMQTLQTEEYVHTSERILSIVQCLHENGCPWGSSVCTMAAGRGYPGVLTYAHEHGCPWNEEACAAAASTTRNYYHNFNAQPVLDCLMYLHENGCPWDVSASIAAVNAGNIKTLKYLHENGCPWDESTCATAASAHTLDMYCLQYLHANGCPWDESTCAAAARTGKLQNLQFAHENGCGWDSATCTAAARSWSFACLQYAHEQGCPWDHDTFQAALELKASTSDNHMKARADALLSYLQINGCSRTEEESVALHEKRARGEFGVDSGNADRGQERGGGPASKKIRTASSST